MKEKVTINEIAKMCNVSKSSVSRYLNHGYVSKQNAEKIQAAIDQTGFQSNFFASRIKRKDSHIIGIIVSSFAGYGNGKMLDGILQELSDEHYQGMILQSGGKYEKEKECVTLLQQQGADGIIFLDSLFAENYRDTFDEEKPVLFVNQDCSYAPSISFDEAAATQMLFAYLKAKGHRKVLYLMQHHHNAILRQTAMQSLWPEEHLHVISAALHEDGIYDQAKEAIRIHADVLVCDSDEAALSCMKYFAQMHIRIPQELSIVSFSETPLYHAANPSLTHIAYDYEGFGKYAARSILDHIQKRPISVKKDFFTLVEKESVSHLSV